MSERGVRADVKIQKRIDKKYLLKPTLEQRNYTVTTEMIDTVTIVQDKRHHVMLHRERAITIYQEQTWIKKGSESNLKIVDSVS